MEYDLTQIIKYKCEAEWIYDRVYNEKDELIMQRRKELVERIECNPAGNHLKINIYHRRNQWFGGYPVERVMVVSQHKITVNKMLMIENVIRCNWFLELEDDMNSDTKFVVKKITNKLSVDAAKFRGYVNRFDVRMIQLTVIDIMKDQKTDMNEMKDKKQKKGMSLKKVNSFSDIEDEERIVLICKDDENEVRGDVFGFKRMIDSQQLMQDFYEWKDGRQDLTVPQLYFEQLRQGFVVDESVLDL